MQEEAARRATRAQRFNIPEEQMLQYGPDKEELNRKQRAEKFQTSYNPDAALMDMDLFEERKDVQPDVERRPEAVYLYGVDVMSTKEVLTYFDGYAPKFVEWINDSSCKSVSPSGFINDPQCPPTKLLPFGCFDKTSVGI